VFRHSISSFVIQKKQIKYQLPQR